MPIIYEYIYIFVLMWLIYVIYKELCVYECMGYLDNVALVPGHSLNTACDAITVEPH